MRCKRLALLPAAALLLAGCAGLFGTPEPTPTPMPEPTAAPEPTPEPTPTPAVAGDALTGADDPAFAGQRPVAVTLRNLPEAGPWWGIADAEVLVMGVSEGTAPTMLALYPGVDGVPAKVGPVGPGRDLTLQLALPLNAVPVHIDKNVYAANLLNVLSYQDLDGYHVGKTAFAYDVERSNAGFLPENCWYTNPDLLRAGLDSYGGSFGGDSQYLFDFQARDPVPDGTCTAKTLELGFSRAAHYFLNFDPDTGLYTLFGSEWASMADAASGAEPAFTNVFVLYASSGIKDDGYTRQYDLTGGTGLYLTGGAWQQINWSKEDAGAPLVLTDLEGASLPVNPGRSFIAVWGGYYGQDIQLLDIDGTAQTLPEKPALLDSGVSDEDAAAAEQQYQLQAQLTTAKAELDNAQARLDEALENLAAAQASEDTADDAPATEAVTQATQARDAAQAAYDALLAGLPALPADSGAEGLPEDTAPVPDEAAQAAADAAAAG